MKKELIKHLTAIGIFLMIFLMIHLAFAAMDKQAGINERTYYDTELGKMVYVEEGV